MRDDDREMRMEERDDKRTGMTDEGDDKRDEMMKVVGRYDGRGEDQHWLKMMMKRMRDAEK